MFEIPSLRNKWARPGPAPANNPHIIPSQHIDSGSKNINVYNLEPLNVDEYIESNQPATVNLRNEFDFPLPTIPAPVQYRSKP